MAPPSVQRQARAPTKTRSENKYAKKTGAWCSEGQLRPQLSAHTHTYIYRLQIDKESPARTWAHSQMRRPISLLFFPLTNSSSHCLLVPFTPTRRFQLADKRKECWHVYARMRGTFLDIDSPRKPTKAYNIWSQLSTCAPTCSFSYIYLLLLFWNFTTFLTAFP